MNWKMCRDVFPDIGAYRDLSKIGLRLRALTKIPADHRVILAKIAELTEGEEDGLSQDAIEWMYLVTPEKDRTEVIANYLEVIAETNVETEQCL